MEGFTLALALVDAIPVLLFAASAILLGARLNSPLFLIGAVLSALAGCCKVAWKLILAISKKNLKWLNKCFLPLMGAGWLLIATSLAVGFKNSSWNAKALLTMPSLALLILTVVLSGFMGWYRKARFKNDDAKSNWTAQIINIAAQAALFFAILLAK